MHADLLGGLLVFLHCSFFLELCFSLPSVVRYLFEGFAHLFIFLQLEHYEDSIRELNLKMTSLQGERDQKTHEVGLVSLPFIT